MPSSKSLIASEMFPVISSKKRFILVCGIAVAPSESDRDHDARERLACYLLLGTNATVLTLLGLGVSAPVFFDSSVNARAVNTALALTEDPKNCGKEKNMCSQTKVNEGSYSCSKECSSSLNEAV